MSRQHPLHRPGRLRRGSPKRHRRRRRRSYTRLSSVAAERRDQAASSRPSRGAQEQLTAWAQPGASRWRGEQPIPGAFPHWTLEQEHRGMRFFHNPQAQLVSREKGAAMPHPPRGGDGWSTMGHRSPPPPATAGPAPEWNARHISRSITASA